MKLTHNILTGVAAAIVASLAATPAFAQSAQEAKGQAHPVYINSTPEGYAAMQQLPADEPLLMLNIVRFKDKASYEEGSEFADRGLTGEQAYAEYSRHSAPIANRTGAKVVFAGHPQLTLIGPEHEKWDAIFIISYPNLASFLALVGDPEYKKHAFHRKAAVADSRLVRMASFPMPE